MRKFSKLQNKSIQENLNPPVENQEVLVHKINSLIDTHLRIRSNGSAHRDLLDGSLSISGKEEFIGALINLLKEEVKEGNLEVLESLKNISRDWVLIDNKKYEIESEILKNKFLEENYNHVKKVNNFLKKYGKSENYEEMVEIYLERMTYNELVLRSKVVSLMIRERNSNDILVLEDKINKRLKNY